MKNKVLGRGVNDADYIVNAGGRGSNIVCPIYSMWHNMLKRCYDKQTQTKRPSYKGCSVCDEWLIFSSFRTWVVARDWQGKQLDKDILKEGNKVYSPNNCYLVSNKVNNLANSLSTLCGVSKTRNKNRYRAYFSECGKQINLGVFNSKQEALLASADFKINSILKNKEISGDRVLYGSFIMLANSYYEKITTQANC